MRRIRRLGLWLGMILLTGLVGWQVSAQGSLSQAQLEQGSYAQSCGSCHIALPAQVLPQETWRRLLQDSDHYGQRIVPPSGVVLQLAWNYLRRESRPTVSKESIPFRLADSRYFKAMHPQITFPQPVRATTCIDCHPQVKVGDFISLTPEWKNK